MNISKRTSNVLIGQGFLALVLLITLCAMEEEGIVTKENQDAFFLAIIAILFLSQWAGLFWVLKEPPVSKGTGIPVRTKGEATVEVGK